MPILLGFSLPSVLAAVLTLGAYSGAYLAEIFRSGILSVATGQRLAALALGMSGAQALRRVILPQAIARVLPALGGLWIGLFKDTSILSVIGVGELMYEGRMVATDTYRPLEVFTRVAIIYYIVAYPQALGVSWIFQRFQVCA